ncbi:unnamed protein product [Linum trigynum]|uniref:Uncharacterized protein n=1 Tax=Linum trigynum TaxID=586398 RepID=A0AAV2D9T5_9ROSI
MAEEFETSIEYWLKLSKRIYYDKESAATAPSVPTPSEMMRQMMSRRSSTGGGSDQQISYLSTAVTIFAVVSEPLRSGQGNSWVPQRESAIIPGEFPEREREREREREIFLTVENDIIKVAQGQASRTKQNRIGWKSIGQYSPVNKGNRYMNRSDRFNLE